MKTIVTTLSLAALCFCSSFIMEGTTRTMSTVMSYNIHNENCTEQPRSWEDRKSMVAQLIRNCEPELVGIQGSTLGQIDWLNSNLPSYLYFAPVEGNLRMGTDLCPIMYSDEVYELLDQGTFLIGEAVQADDESDKQSQFLNWVKLNHRVGEKVIYVLNTRIQDNTTSDSQVAERMEEIIKDLVGTDTFVLLGDLQSTPESETVSQISEWAIDSFESSLVCISEVEATHFGWDRQPVGKRVDYVFLSSDILANSYEVIDVAMEDEYPSDHLPVFCRFRLQ